MEYVIIESCLWSYFTIVTLCIIAYIDRREILT